MQHGFLPLGNVDHEAQQHTGPEGEHEVADPGERQVGVMFFMLAEVAAACGIEHAGDDVAVAERNALGRPGCT